MRVDHPILSATGVRGIRWTARSLAAVGILFRGFAVLSAFSEGGRVRRLPFVLEGAPFGTCAQSTQLGIFSLGSGFALSLVGAALAFRWEAVAARILLASGAVQALLWAFWLPDRTKPPRGIGVIN